MSSVTGAGRQGMLSTGNMRTMMRRCLLQHGKRQPRQRRQGGAGLSSAHAPGSCASQETRSSELGNLSPWRSEIDGLGVGAHVTWDIGRPAGGRQVSLFTSQIVPSVKTTTGWSGQSGTAWRHQRQRRTGAAYGTFVSRRDFWSFGRNKQKPEADSVIREDTYTAFPKDDASSGSNWESGADAWKAPSEEPGGAAEQAVESFQNASSPPEFRATDPFATSPEALPAAASDAVSAASSTAPEVAVAAATNAASSSDLGMWPHHLCMQLIETVDLLPWNSLVETFHLVILGRYVHATAGVPHWQAILLTTVAARVVVLPLMVSTTANSLRMSMAAPEMEVVQRKLKDIQNRVKANPEIRDAAMGEMHKLTSEMRGIYSKYNVHVGRMFYAFAQIPVFISLFFATKEMGNHFPGYATGGLSWAADLGATDPSYVLPVVTWVSMQALVELGTGVPPSQNSRFNMMHTMRAMGIITLPISLTMPSGVLVYWSTSNLFALLQRIAMDIPSIRRALGIPLVEELPQRPRQGVPQEASFAPKDDSTSEEELDRWAGGDSRKSPGDTLSEHEVVAKASKEKHEELKREYASGGQQGQGAADGVDKKDGEGHRP